MIDPTVPFTEEDIPAVDPGELPPFYPVTDPRGWITPREPLPADLERAEQETEIDDVTEKRTIRTATPEEIALLRARFGYSTTEAAPGLPTIITRRPGVRCRRWPTLRVDETGAPAPANPTTITDPNEGTTAP